MIKTIDVGFLLNLDGSIPIADVRTPAEFEHGHICGAFNIPLFSNEERVQVGTTYKKIGREEAILLGFDLTGAKWSGFIKQALEIAPQKKIAVHCWRGGMRSGAMAWALSLYGFEVYLLEGGYKKYRRWVLDQFEHSYKLIVLGGFTGSGKTQALHEMDRLGEQVIDLEDLAQHQGSSFGTMGKLIQPTQEQFENDFAKELSMLSADKSVWVEDESISIGKRFIPMPFFIQMRSAPLVRLQVETELRIKSLAAEYGRLNKDFLTECTERIRKRLGPEQAKNALQAISENRMEDFVRIVLVYYDKTYSTGLRKRSEGSVHEIGYNGAASVPQIIQLSHKISSPTIQS